LSEQSFEVPWIKKKIDSGEKIEIDRWYVMAVYPDQKYVIALLLTDDGKSHI